MALVVGFIFAAYLIGSVSFAVLVSRLCGLPDPHTYGSGNPGATNVLRTGNKAAAALTLLGDALKGFVTVFVAKGLVAANGMGSYIVALAAAAVFVGHLFPAYHHFKGGKGVATAAGILFGVDFRLGLLLVGIWLLIALVTRYSSLAAIITAVSAPLAAWLMLDNQYMVSCLVAISAMLLVRHANNVRKLLAGEERQIRLKRTPPA